MGVMPLQGGGHWFESSSAHGRETLAVAGYPSGGKGFCCLLPTIGIVVGSGCLCRFVGVRRTLDGHLTDTCSSVTSEPVELPIGG